VRAMTGPMRSGRWAAAALAGGAIAAVAVAAAGASPRHGARQRARASAVTDRQVAAALGGLPAADFPVAVVRARNPGHGTLTFAFDGISLSARGTSISTGRAGSITRTRRELVLTFANLRYRVSAIELPGGERISPQTIALRPRIASTLRIDRHTGAVTADLQWIVTAPNTLYNGSHTIDLADHGMRRFASFRRSGKGFVVQVITHWHATVSLRRFSVAAHPEPRGTVVLTGIWDGFYNVVPK
jgi:hypothetical protein